MSAPIPTVEPAQLAAGDSYAFLKNLSDYPPPDWSLSYVFTGNKLSKATFTSEASGINHQITLSAADTADLLPGVYSVSGFAKNAVTGERVTIFSGHVIVTFNPETANEGQDTRSWAKKNLDAVEEAISNRTNKVLITSQNGETRFEYKTDADLMEMRANLKVIVRNEEIAELQAQGKPSGRTVYAQFTRKTSNTTNWPT